MFVCRRPSRSLDARQRRICRSQRRHTAQEFDKWTVAVALIAGRHNMGLGMIVTYFRCLCRWDCTRENIFCVVEHRLAGWPLRSGKLYNDFMNGALENFHETDPDYLHCGGKGSGSCCLPDDTKIPNYRDWCLAQWLILSTSDSL